MAEIPGTTTRTKPPKQNLTIEEYLDFVHSDKRLDNLTLDHRNQIIHMHGFKKLYNTRKSILLEVVSKMELMDPTRSTIQDEGVTSDAILGLEAVIEDLNDLKWQECCITSLQTLNAVSHRQHGSLESSDCSVGTIVSASSEKPPRKRRRKLRKLAPKGVGDGKKEVVSPRLNIGSSETLPRQTKTQSYANVIGSGVGVAFPVAAGEVQQSSWAVVALDA